MKSEAWKTTFTCSFRSHSPWRFRRLGGDQDQLIAMDGPQFRLAAWVRGLRCERIQSGCRCSLYPDAGSAPPQDDVRAGVYRLVKETPSCIRSAIRIRLKILCRAYGAPLCFFLLTHGGSV